MLPLNDLRIGNWVKMGGQYIQMDVKIFHAVIQGFPGYEPEGIPISKKMWDDEEDPTLLWDNGFEWKQDECYYDYYTDLWFDAQKMEWSLSGQSIKISYVHELQNITYDLTKKEMLITKEHL